MGRRTASLSHAALLAIILNVQVVGRVESGCLKALKQCLPYQITYEQRKADTPWTAGAHGQWHYVRFFEYLFCCAIDFGSRDMECHVIVP